MIYVITEGGYEDYRVLGVIQADDANIPDWVREKLDDRHRQWNDYHHDDMWKVLGWLKNNGIEDAQIIPWREIAADSLPSKPLPPPTLEEIAEHERLEAVRKQQHHDALQERAALMTKAYNESKRSYRWQDDVLRYD